MTSVGKTKKADDLCGQAEKLLSKGRHFEAEEKAHKALTAARSAHAFDRMARIVPVLCAARRARHQQAIEVGTVTILDEAIDEDLGTEPGCYLIQPPLVGADARRLRASGLETGTPVAVVCREPITRLGLCPIVAICPGTTVRTQIDPPEDLESPDIEWFVEALQQLGDWAISTVDSDMEPVKRVDALIERLGAVPEHEGLHEALIAACLDAHEASTDDADSGSGNARRSPARST
ncbi:MAG: hypothetical protein ACYTJ0_16205 [Planctomycetota bacterium]|jgi:hypothetical protein